MRASPGCSRPAPKSSPSCREATQRPAPQPLPHLRRCRLPSLPRCLHVIRRVVEESVKRCETGMAWLSPRGPRHLAPARWGQRRENQPSQLLFLSPSLPFFPPPPLLPLPPRRVLRLLLPESSEAGLATGGAGAVGLEAWSTRLQPRMQQSVSQHSARTATALAARAHQQLR